MSLKICREGILKLKPYIPGKPIEEVQREYGLKDVVKLASNENPLGPSPKAIEAIRKAAEKVAIYPDGSCYALKNAVAAHLGIESNMLTFGAGSDEVIHEIGVAFLEDGDEVISADPTFSQYETAAICCECDYRKVPLVNYVYDLNSISEMINEKTKLVFIANPNNPTGTLVTHSEIEALLEKLPERAVLVLDEAYYEYNERADYPDGLSWVKAGKNVLLLRTFSKIYGLAGLRIGYAIGKPDLIAYLDQVRLPFNVSSIAQMAAIASIGDPSHVEASKKLNSEGKNYFYSEFDRLGLPYAESEANFVWFDLKRNSVAIFKELLKRGVIIRTGDIFGTPTYARVSIGTMQENRKFIETLEEVLPIVEEAK